jgi:hemoglobin/transferrin/lactoferrin receptor protein
VVNIITKNNFYSQMLTFGGNIISDYNSVNNSTAGNILFHAGADKWFLKLNGTTRKAGNIKTPSGELNNSGFKDTYISGTLGVRPFSKHEVKLNYQYYLAKDAGIPGGYPLFPNNALVTYPKEERTLLSGEYKFSQISKLLTDISAKIYYQYIFRDVENLPYIVQKVLVNGILKKKVSMLSIKPQADHDTKGITFQTGWLFGKYNFVIAGFDGWQRNLDSRREKEQKIEDYDSTGTVVIKTTNQIIGERPIPISSFRSLGFFVQDEIRLFKDKLKVNLGGRIDQVKITNEIAYNPEYTITNGVRTDKPTGQKIIWNPKTVNDISWSANLGMMYAVTKNMNITFNTARSFRSPSLEERYQYIDLGSLVRLGNPDLNPENGLFLDAGLKIYSPILQFTGNGFFNEIKDLVIEIPGTYEGRQAMIKTNAGKSRFYGFDFSFEYNPYKKIVVYGTTSYVRGKDIENNIDLPLIPPLNGTIGVRTAVSNYANVELSLVYFADQKNIASGEFTTGGYSYYNIYLQTVPFVFSNIKLNFNAGVENIFNRSYRNHLSTNRGTITEEPGRNVFVKLVIGI